MIEGKPSRTALMTAVMRAHHFLTAPEPKILHDDIALGLSGLASKAAILAYMDKVTASFTALSDPVTAEQFVRHTSEAVCMRSRLVEERLVRAKTRGLKQLVILGAGLDSTAYRGALTEGLSVFEIDHPATQAWKQAQLKKAGISVPDNLRFVGFDFEQQTLEDALKRGGIDMGAMTLFPWLGVHMYLTDEAVKSTLNVLGQFPKDSELVMDFVMPDYSHDKTLIPDTVQKLAKVVAEMGEPFLSLYTEADLELRLHEAGFSDITFYNSKTLIELFLNGNKNAYSLPDSATSLLSARI